MILIVLMDRRCSDQGGLAVICCLLFTTLARIYTEENFSLILSRYLERRYMVVAFDVKLQLLLFCSVISVHLALYTLDCFLSRLYITSTLPALSVSSVQ